MRLRLLLSAFLLPLLSAAAQSVRWDPAGGTLAAGETTPLQLVFTGCSPKGDPALPKIDNLQLQYSGQSSNTSWINGDYSQSVTFTYAAMLIGGQGVTIPAFTVATNHGSIVVPAAHFDPGTATIGDSGRTLDSAAHSHLQASSETVWAGQVFGLNYSIEADQSYSPDFGTGAFRWDPGPLVSEDWSQGEPFTTSSGDAQNTGFSYHSRAFLREPGTYHLTPIRQLVNLSVGVTGLGFFQQRSFQQFAVTSDAPALEVRPLPPAPERFSGAVGRFKLVSRIAPVSATVGEPVTWTLELSGTGNWPAISGLPPREVSRDFQVVQPRPRRVPAAGKLFDAKLSEDVVLIPTLPGSYTLPSVSFIYFDPDSGSYQTASTQASTVTIAPGAPAASSASRPAAAVGAPPVAPELPASLPRDPLPSAGSASRPWTASACGLLLAAPFLALPLFWGWLALRSARRDDPLLPRRQARRRLAAGLSRLRSAPSDRERLAAWQRDAAAFWGVSPSTSAGAAVSAAGADWTALWNEADRALYAAGSGLPADWTARAEAALAAAALPRFAPSQALRARHLLPWVFALAFGLCLPALRADPVGTAAYRRGDFAEAERAARAALAADPEAWAERYDLSLSLAQQSRWEEAAAQATAALVQHPSDDAVRWQWRLACDQAGYVPPPLESWLSPSLREGLAGLASPAQWQWVLVFAAVLAAAALAGFLLLGYGLRRNGAAAVLGCAIGLAFVLAVAALVGRDAYGDAADPRAAIVWRASTLRSIPTEADTAQKTAPLPAGSLGLVDKSFLGWVRLDFANGQTGWVRRDEVIGLWR